MERTLQHTLGVPLYTPENNQRNFLTTHNGTNAMIPVEVGEPSTKRLLYQQQQNEDNIRVELETTDEVREITRIKEVVKLRATRRYNTKVQPWAFQSGDLVWWVRGEARKDPQAGKLGPNREGPFRVTTNLDNGVYWLQELDGRAIPRTWNAIHLKFYFNWPTLQTQCCTLFPTQVFCPKNRKLGFWLEGFLTRHV